MFPIIYTKSCQLSNRKCKDKSAYMLGRPSVAQMTAQKAWVNTERYQRYLIPPKTPATGLIQFLKYEPAS